MRKNQTSGDSEAKMGEEEVKEMREGNKKQLQAVITNEFFYQTVRGKGFKGEKKVGEVIDLGKEMAEELYPEIKEKVRKKIERG